MKTTIVLVVLLGGCAHNASGPTTTEEIVRADGERMKAFLNNIPGCSTAKGAVPLSELPGEKPAWRVRGFLIRDEGICTLMKCDKECCNRCSGTWRLAATKNGEGNALTFSPPLSWQAMDCSLPSLASSRRGVEVIVTGTIRPRKPEGESAGPPPQETSDEIAHSAICQPLQGGTD